MKNLKIKDTAKTVGFDMTKDKFTCVDLIDLEFFGKKVDARKADKIYEAFRNSPRVPNTCFIFKDTLRVIMDEMSEEDKRARAIELKALMLNPANFSEQSPEGRGMSSSKLKQVVAWEKELRALGY